MDEVSIILIGGTSHTGKSTLAQALAQQLGWHCLSTDRLARHPGRPWKTNQKAVPPHVADHYAALSVDELLADVLRHYQRMWPMIENAITSRTAHPPVCGLLIEGSALWPEQVVTFLSKSASAVWLTASDDLIRQRIYETSKFDQATDQEKSLIQKFLERTLLYNRRMLVLVDHLGLNCINVENASNLNELSTVCLDVLEK